MDGTATAETFQHAARFEVELTERQRDVLRLIAAGKTNPEIADALGMTLAGAKWHVSELLTKLGLESREAAAEYHQWRQAPHRRVSRRLHAALSGAALKFGLAAAGGIGAIGIGAALVLAMRGDDIDPGPAVPGLPFYMETVFTREEERYAYAAARRYWYQDSSRTRTESDTPVVTRSDPGFGMDFGVRGTSAIVRDGAKEWRQNGPTYSGTPLDTFPDEPRRMDGTEVGPLPYRTLEAYADSLRSPANEIATRGDRLLGREVTVIEVTTRDSEGKVVAREEHWADAERLLVLKSRYEIAVEGVKVVATQRVTKIEYGRDQPPGRFVWTPAPGTFEKTCPRLGDVVTAGGLTPPPFLNVPVVAAPDGFELRSFGGSQFPDARCDMAEVHYRFERGPSGSPESLNVRQDVSDASSVLTSSKPIAVDLAGTEARLGDANDGGRSVAWVTPEVGIEIRSTTLTDEDLIAFATAMVAANQ